MKEEGRKVQDFPKILVDD